MENKEAGLTDKYAVSRTDGRDNPGGDRDSAQYFVLDYYYDPLAQAALEYYAEIAFAEGFEALATDLRDRLKYVLNKAGIGPGAVMEVDFVRARQEARSGLDLRRWSAAASAVAPDVRAHLHSIIDAACDEGGVLVVTVVAGIKFRGHDEAGWEINEDDGERTLTVRWTVKP